MTKESAAVGANTDHGGEDQAPKQDGASAAELEIDAGRAAGSSVLGSAVGALGRPRRERHRPNPARKAVAEVKVKRRVSWGSIVLSGAAGVLALAIIGVGVYQVYVHSLSWQDRADRIDGIRDYRRTDKAMIGQREAVWGPRPYKLSPPVAGNYNPNWMRCLGDVYPAQIANEHAVHSLELGAVWITYNPSLPAGEVEKLAKRVRGNDYMFMSPYPGLDTPISLQAWGFQLKIHNADDKRIDQFITALRQNATLEAGTSCSSGDFITETGATPHDLGKDASAGTGG